MRYHEEALKRMRSRKTETIQWTLPRLNKRYEFSILPSEQGRNYDGSHAGYPGGTILQLKAIPLDGGRPRYTNWHNIKQN